MLSHRWKRQIPAPHSSAPSLQAMSTAQINRARVQGEPPDPCSPAAAVSLGKERCLKHSRLTPAPPRGSDASLIPPTGRSRQERRSPREGGRSHSLRLLCLCFQRGGRRLQPRREHDVQHSGDLQPQLRGSVQRSEHKSTSLAGPGLQQHVTEPGRSAPSQEHRSPCAHPPKSRLPQLVEVLHPATAAWPVLACPRCHPYTP